MWYFFSLGQLFTLIQVNSKFLEIQINTLIISNSMIVLRSIPRLALNLKSRTASPIHIITDLLDPAAQTWLTMYDVKCNLSAQTAFVRLKEKSVLSLSILN